VRTPQHLPRARHHVDHVIRLATTLLELDAAYERDGHIYFRGAGVPDVAGLDRDHARSLLVEYADTPDDPRRDNPFDVPVWRPSDTAHPAWPSPWGPGRPGWHAECTAMALASLGGLVDVLIGGEDLAFPHHAYQAAMARAAVGGQFARAQMNVGSVRYQGTKMAKSTGNLVLVSDLLRTVPGPVIRLLLLNRHWSHPWDFDPADLDTAAANLDRLYKAAGSTADDATGVDGVRGALLDDLDVVAAVSVAHDAGGDAARLLIRTLALD
jgi:L-cysteine:1D-myo-inositol 2-amino-2-deoxy-alpha-D-glucopyranoside ligase